MASRTRRRQRVFALLGAFALFASVQGAALAATSSVSWDYTGGRDLVLNVPLEAGTISLAVPAGSTCVAEVEVINGQSTHPNNNLIVDWNSDELLTIENFEIDPFTTIVRSAEFVATGSDELVVSIVFTNPARTESKTSSTGSLTVTCEDPPDGGGEGCTPGYWKQDQHFDSWEATGYAPGDSFDVVFGVDSDFDTLLDALEAKGGQDNALARHATAALLNASNPDVSYDMSADEVMDLVKEAFDSGEFEAAKDVLADFNEQGCPLN